MADRVLLTGISGFVGGHLALQLLEMGYLVRGSVRNLDRAAKVRETLGKHGADLGRLEIVGLDLMSDAGWAAAMDGVRYLQHVASPFVTVMPDDRNELIVPATEGVRRALTTALAAGVERIVLTSSMAAVTYGHDPRRTAPFTAADWTNLSGRPVNAYVESKARAEREAWRIADAAGAHDRLVSVNPSAILGPLLDEDPGSSAALIIGLLNGSAPVAPRISFNIIDVRDVAALHVAAMEKPAAAGRRFPFGNGNRSLWQLSQVIRQRMPEYASRMPRFELPDALARLLALVNPQLRANAGELGVVKPIDASEAMTLLGRPPIPPEDAIVATARSLVEQHLVPPAVPQKNH